MSTSSFDLRTATTNGGAWTPRMLSILRIVAGLCFLEHGMQKILGFPPPNPAAGGSPDLFTLLWFAGMFELIGGFLVLIGFFTRPAALLLSGEMAIAYWTFHARRGFFPALNGGDAAILFCFIFLYITLAGPGPWSIDQARLRR